jgi:hypothetical protein
MLAHELRQNDITVKLVEVLGGIGLVGTSFSLISQAFALWCSMFTPKKVFWRIK